MDDENYEFLKKIILKLTKIDLDNYKSQQMRRRLTTFWAQSNTPSVAVFCQKLEQDSAALQKLKDFLTINVSSFYRDNHLYEKLQKIIMSKILNEERSINIWSAGCSRGQEPYSIAMMLESFIPPVDYTILASDIDTGALQIAQAGGPYTKDDIKELPEIFRSRFTIGPDGKYIVNPDLRKNITFRQQDLLLDRFSSGFDLIICRNVTIYFTEEAKRNLNSKFHESLKENGILFIGGTEVMLEASKIGFKSIDVCFYQKQVTETTSTRPVTLNIPIKA